MSAPSLTFHSCAASVKPVISPVLSPDLFWCSRLRLCPSPYPPYKLLQTMSCSSCVIGSTVMLCNHFSFSLCQCCRTFVLWHVCLTLSIRVKANWRRWPGSLRAAANPLSRDHKSLILSTLQRSFKNQLSFFLSCRRCSQGRVFFSSNRFLPRSLV